MSISYDYYKIFYKVAECGNITEAARQLFLVQSTVSRTIQNLEQELGCCLMIRSVRGIRLTEEGNILYRHLKQAFAHITAAEEQIENRMLLNEGQIRIGASELTLSCYLLPILEGFMKRHPKIRIELTYATPENAVANLNAGLLDIAVLGSPLGDVQDIYTRKLMRSDFTLIAGSKYSELKDRVVPVEELESYPFITMNKGTSVGLLLEKLSKDYGVRFNTECEVGSMPLLLSMVQLNLGIAFIPEYHLGEVQKKSGVFKVEIDRKIPNQYIYMLMSMKALVNAATLNFMTLLQEYEEEK